MMQTTNPVGQKGGNSTIIKVGVDKVNIIQTRKLHQYPFNTTSDLSEIL